MDFNDILDTHKSNAQIITTNPRDEFIKQVKDAFENDENVFFFIHSMILYVDRPDAMVYYARQIPKFLIKIFNNQQHFLCYKSYLENDIDCMVQIFNLYMEGETIFGKMFQRTPHSTKIIKLVGRVRVEPDNLISFSSEYKYLLTHICYQPDKYNQEELGKIALNISLAYLQLRTKSSILHRTETSSVDMINIKIMKKHKKQFMITGDKLIRVLNYAGPKLFVGTDMIILGNPHCSYFTSLSLVLFGYDAVSFSRCFVCRKITLDDAVNKIHGYADKKFVRVPMEYYTLMFLIKNDVYQSKKKSHGLLVKISKGLPLSILCKICNMMMGINSDKVNNEVFKRFIKKYV